MNQKKDVVYDPYPGISTKICEVHNYEMNKNIVPIMKGMPLGESLELEEIREKYYPNCMIVNLYGERAYDFSYLFQCDKCFHAEYKMGKKLKQDKLYSFISYKKDTIPTSILQFNKFDEVKKLEEENLSKFSLIKKMRDLNPNHVSKGKKYIKGRIDQIEMGRIYLDDSTYLNFWYKHFDYFRLIIIKDQENKSEIIVDLFKEKFLTSELNYSNKNKFIKSIENRNEIKQNH